MIREPAWVQIPVTLLALTESQKIGLPDEIVKACPSLFALFLENQRHFDIIFGYQITKES